MDFLTTHTNAALSEFEKVSDVTSKRLQTKHCFQNNSLFSHQVARRYWKQREHKLNRPRNNPTIMHLKFPEIILCSLLAVT